MPEKSIRVATDVGGTFTDLVCFETDLETGRSSVRTAKSDTTPPDFETGVLNVLRKGEVDPATVNFLAHGTTVVINALTERKGVKVGLIATEGFRDTLEIARGNRPDFFNLHYVQAAKPFVPRYLRRELPGRISYQAARRCGRWTSPACPASSRTSRTEGCGGGGDLLPALLRRPSRTNSARWPSCAAVAGGLCGLVAPDHPRMARV